MTSDAQAPVSHISFLFGLAVRIQRQRGKKAEIASPPLPTPQRKHGERQSDQQARETPSPERRVTMRKKVDRHLETRRDDKEAPVIVDLCPCTPRGRRKDCRSGHYVVSGVTLLPLPFFYCPLVS